MLLLISMVVLKLEFGIRRYCLWSSIFITSRHSEKANNSVAKEVKLIAIPPFPVCDTVLIPGLLPIFLHGCEIKSGRGLGTRPILM